MRPVHCHGHCGNMDPCNRHDHDPACDSDSTHRPVGERKTHPYNKTEGHYIPGSQEPSTAIHQAATPINVHEA
jgi:hypothetical protein